MFKVVLIRLEQTDTHTLGVLTISKNSSQQIVSYTIEPPWKDNQENISCIPLDNYKIKRYRSNSFGIVYKVMDVPNRTDIYFHVGNRVWDPATDTGDTKGCICLGDSIIREPDDSRWNYRNYVYPSRLAMDRFMDLMSETVECPLIIVGLNI
jgi:hypothetical protein